MVWRRLSSSQNDNPHLHTILLTNTGGAHDFTASQPTHTLRQNLERGCRRKSKLLRAMGTGARRTLGNSSRIKALVFSTSASRAARIDPLVSIFIAP
jgi:hypothetical protein